MKNLLVLLFIFIASVSTAFACPYCGCGNSNFQIGVLPTFSNAFFGVRYSYSRFKTDSSSQFSRDYFHTTEIWGGYKIGRWQAIAFIPYLDIHKTSDDGVVKKSGLGDITFLLNYQLLSNRRDTIGGRSSLVHTLLVGGGIKAKTGQSLVDLKDPDFSIGDFTHTPGTGSTDYLINVTDNLLIGDNGIVTNVAYKINTINSQQYRLGNRLYVNVAYFHSINLGAYVFRPSVGINFVGNRSNIYQSQPIPWSAGYVVSGMAGLNVQRGKVGLLLNAFLPISQNLFKGLTTFRERESVALTYSF